MPIIQGYADEVRFPAEMRRVEIHNVEGKGAPLGFVEVSATTAMLAHLFKPHLLPWAGPVAALGRARIDPYNSQRANMEAAQGGPNPAVNHRPAGIKVV